MPMFGPHRTLRRHGAVVPAPPRLRVTSLSAPLRTPRLFFLTTATAITTATTAAAAPFSCFLCVSKASFSHSAVAQPPPPLLQCGEVVTRLGPSERVPGLRGVFVTRAIKKFYPIEVLPAAAHATSQLDATEYAETASNNNDRDNTSGGGDAVRARLLHSRDGTRTATPSSSSSPTSQPDSSAVQSAPPLVLNLAFAPRHHISLRRFLALRHMFSANNYLHAANDDGWFLIAPSSAAPLCADVAGLRRWVSRHHPRYLQRHRQPTSAAPSIGTAPPPVDGRNSNDHDVHYDATVPAGEEEDLAKWEAALDSGEELTEAQLRALAERERKQAEEEEEEARREASIDEDEDERDEAEELEEEEESDEQGNRHESNGSRGGGREGEGESAAARSATALERSSVRSSQTSTASSSPPVSSPHASPHTLSENDCVSHKPRLRMLPPLITESHLFEVNDGVFWELPPADDLANHDYWKGHRQRMHLYESTGDATDAAEQRESLLATLRADPRAQSCTEQQLHAAVDILYDTLKRKANVSLSVDSTTGLLTLLPLRDLAAGEELLLHYGREWWTGRLLSSLLLAVEDGDMPQIRWIEQLFFGHAEDTNELFPCLVPARRQPRRQRATGRTGGRGSGGGRHDRDARRVGDDQRTPSALGKSGDEVAEPAGPLVLYNTVTRSRATDAAVLAFAVRRSCVHQAFFNRLLLGDPERNVQPIFRLSTPDAEVPMRVLRRVLLASLRGQEAGPMDSEAVESMMHAAAGSVDKAETDGTTGGVQRSQQQVLSSSHSHTGTRSIGDSDSDDEGDGDGVFSV